ncbi:MAG: GntR family transcriptional regulator [Pseudomonadales bacterium]|nr:GntR family transcriptional regulator [Pseudomonadales bacterium]
MQNTFSEQNLEMHRTISDSLFCKLQTAIIKGELKAGSKISEPELARKFGVSRAPLREAISRLEGQKLVERRAHVGARVVSLSLKELVEISYMREALEGMACRLAAANMTEEEVFKLKYLLSVHEKNEDLKEGHAYYQKEGDLDFHYCIVQGSHNQKLIQLLCNELYYLMRMYRYQFSVDTPRPKNAFDEHHAIVAAIEQRDGALSEQLMRKHISAARINIEQQFNDKC